jgi:uncharacterized protein YlxP (DUF503 family)
LPVGKLTLELSIPNAHSLKDKLRHSFNLSVAELDEDIVWNRATLGAVRISGSTAYLNAAARDRLACLPVY